MPTTPQDPILPTDQTTVNEAQQKTYLYFGILIATAIVALNVVSEHIRAYVEEVEFASGATE